MRAEKGGKNQALPRISCCQLHSSDLVPDEESLIVHFFEGVCCQAMSTGAPVSVTVPC